MIIHFMYFFKMNTYAKIVKIQFITYPARLSDYYYYGTTTTTTVCVTGSPEHHHQLC